MGVPVLFLWFGAAGIELRVDDQVLVVDPYFTRIHLWRVVLGRVHPNHELIADTIQRCDHVLVTHAHFDHLMDVPDVIRNTGATALGSPNTCELLAVCGVPADNIREVVAGDELGLGNFRVVILPSEHLKGFGYATGPLSPGLHPPLRARDYRRDSYFGFLIECGGILLLFWTSVKPEPQVQADLLFLEPYAPRSTYESLVPAVQPRVVMPMHWDDFFRPLSKPLRPGLMKWPSWSFPPLKRVDLEDLGRTVQQAVPEARFFVPELLRIYDLGEIVSVPTAGG